MLRRHHVLTTGLVLASASLSANAQSQDELSALGTAYAVYAGAGYLKDKCATLDPASAAKVGQAYAAWLKAQNLGNFEAQIGQKVDKATLTRLRQSIGSSLDAALEKMGPPSQSCPALASQFSTDTFNVRKQVPNLDAILGAKSPAGNTGSKPAGTSNTAGTTNAAANITLYSVAQLSSLMAQAIAPVKRSQQDSVGFQKLKSLGPIIAVSGTKQRSRSITQSDDRRTAKFDVYCYDMLNDSDDPPNGQITVLGRVRNFEADFGITLDRCTVLSPGHIAQLKKSTLPVADAGWRFKAQPAEKFLVAAGQGLKDSEILGAYMEESYSTGVGGMSIITYPVSLFLKDGTVYSAPYWAPNSFNYKLSRQLEPQKWGKWTKKGNNFAIKWGNGNSSTFEVKGSPKPLAAGTKLSGVFESISGGGNTALGGDVSIMNSKVYNFRPNGSFTGDRSTAAISGGGAYSNGSTAASAQSKQAGSYNISGYGITLKSGNGQEQRLFFARYNQDLMYIGSSTYTLDK